MEEFEEMVPEWAIKKSDGSLELGANLPTRDGRRRGNAHIVGIRQNVAHDGGPVYRIITDAGNEMNMSASEIAEAFWPPVWVSDINDVFIRARMYSEVI